MFLHVGGDVSVLNKDIIAIFDVRSSKGSQITKDFLEDAAVEGSLVWLTDKEKIKSIILTDKNVILSPISSFTLFKRAFQTTSDVEPDQ